MKWVTKIGGTSVGGLVAALAIALSGCAGASPYETITSEDVSVAAAGSNASNAKALVDWSGSEGAVLTYPAPCSRKGCGPEAMYHEEVREAAVLVSAVELIDKVARPIVDGGIDAEEARMRLAIVQERLPLLQARVEALRLELEDTGLVLSDFHSLHIAHQRLERADTIARRLSGQLAGEGRLGSGGTSGGLAVVGQ